MPRRLSLLVVLLACDRRTEAPEPPRLPEAGISAGSCAMAGHGDPAAGDIDDYKAMYEIPTISEFKHGVELKFLADRFEVASFQFRPTLPDSADPLCNQPHHGGPSNCVSWHEANEHCASLGKRLPTEQEWEAIAKRITASGANPWPTEDDACQFAVLKSAEGDGCGTATTWPTGSKMRGATMDGVLHMAGNVSEWTATAEGDDVVVRGGNFRSPPASGGIFERRVVSPEAREPEIGFRCVAWCDCALDDACEVVLTAPAVVMSQLDQSADLSTGKMSCELNRKEPTFYCNEAQAVLGGCG